jgi:hypothetical protein
MGLFSNLKYLQSENQIEIFLYSFLGLTFGKICSVFAGFSVGFFSEIVQNGLILPNLINLQIKVSGWGSCVSLCLLVDQADPLWNYLL